MNTEVILMCMFCPTNVPPSMVAVLLANVNCKIFCKFSNIYNGTTDPEKPKNVVLSFANNISRSASRYSITKQPESNGTCKCINIFLNPSRIRI